MAKGRILSKEEEIDMIELYLNKKTSTDKIAKIFKIHSTRVRAFLEKNNILKSKLKGTPLNDLRLNNLKCKNGKSWRDLLHLKIKAALKVGKDIDIEWLKSFKDIDKLRFLNRSLAHRDYFGDYTKEFYIKFIEKHYSDYQFNKIYLNWLKSGKKRNFKPSLDHIIPRIRSGETTLDNTQFITYFENRCKWDMSQEEWDEIKKHIQDYFI